MANIYVDQNYNGANGSPIGTASRPYLTIGEAIDQAGFVPLPEAVSIYVQDGTYTETLAVDRGNLQFVATNGPANAVIAPVSGNAIDLSGNLGAANTVSFDGFGLTGGHTGVKVASSTVLASLTLNNMVIADSAQAGVVVNDVPGLGAVTIQNSTFTDAGSGAGNSNGSGAIVLFDFHADATISDVEIVSTDTSATANADRPDNAIQVSGFDQATYDVTEAIGTVSITGVTITGAYEKPPILVQGFTDLNGLSFTDVTIDGTTGRDGAFGALVFIDPMGSSSLSATADTSGAPGIFTPQAGKTHTLDLSGITIVNNTNPLATYDVFVRGTDADDVYTGTNGRDFLNAPSEIDGDVGGDDTLFGLGGDDILVGGQGDDTLDGGAGNDTAIYGGSSGDFSIATTTDVNGRVTGFVSVTDNNEGDGDEGTDTLTGIETLKFSDQTVSFAGSVQLFDDTGNFVNSYNNVEDSVDAASNDYTILLDTGSVNAENTSPDGQVLVDNDLTITGRGNPADTVGSAIIANADTSIIRASADTGTDGDSRGMFLVNDGVQFDLNDLGIDGNGFSIWQALRVLGSSNIDNVAFSNISYQASGSPYAGIAVTAFDDATASVLNVSNSSFADIGRVGALYYGSTTSGVFNANTYTGKGAVDGLDYAVEVGAGASATISGNTISDNRGVTSTDGSTSGGILVTTFYGAGTSATIENNTFTDNSTGIFVGHDEFDTSNVTLSGINTINSSFSDARGLVVIGDATVTGVSASLTGNAATVHWSGGAGDNIIEGAALGDNLVGNGGNDTITANAGDDTLDGGAGNDTLDGGSGDDTLDGGSGDDILNGGAGADFMLGGEGNDAYVADDAGDAVIEFAGGGDNDSVYSTINYTLFHNVENLVLIEGTGATAGFGNNASNQLFGNSNANVLFGRGGDDAILGLDGNDYLKGGDGNDYLDGGLGDDFIEGDDGKDVAYGGAGADNFFGGAGEDLAFGGAEADGLNGGAGNDALFGEAGNDFLSGDGGNDGLYGGTDNDGLLGGVGDDYLNGGFGDDYLDGGSGGDTLTGGAGNDLFVFAAGNEVDYITDFEGGLGIVDLIQVAGQFSDFSEVLASSYQSGDDTVIVANGGNDILVLQDTLFTTLVEDDFLFA